MLLHHYCCCCCTQVWAAEGLLYYLEPESVAPTLKVGPRRSGGGGGVCDFAKWFMEGIRCIMLGSNVHVSLLHLEPVSVAPMLKVGVKE
jgi:hypothetical protein